RLPRAPRPASSSSCRTTRASREERVPPRGSARTWRWGPTRRGGSARTRSGGNRAARQQSSTVQGGSSSGSRGSEGTLNACYNRIAGPAGRGEVLTNFSPEQAEKAAEQLRKAGFVVEVEMAQGGPPARSPPPAGAKAASTSGGVRDLLLGN
ncbi:unnamed protein product, partial [Prorocentrum cordatum]